MILCEYLRSMLLYGYSYRTITEHRRVARIAYAVERDYRFYRYYVDEVAQPHY